MLRRLLLLTALLAFSGVFAAAEAKTLRMAYDADPTSLDPHEQLASATLQLSHLTFDPLLRFRQDLTLEPRLAKSWEKIDDRTTRFHLREGVHFHSGRTLSAQDVVWTFNRLKQSPDFKALFEPFSEAKAVNDLTVDLITKGPYPLVLDLATYIFPMDREFYSGTDERGRPKDEIVKQGASFARYRAVHRHRPRGGRKTRIQAFRRLLGQVLTWQCRPHRVHADQGAGHARGGASRRRC
jgi:peptide/nickel transport system substrate-binding protein